jgi:hypothetical protein
MQLKKRRKNVTFELKKYIVDVEMLSQLRLPTIGTFVRERLDQCLG